MAPAQLVTLHGDPIRQSGLAARCIAIGDSITQMSSSATAEGLNYAALGIALSAGRLRYLRNAGVSGQTTSQIAARLSADVLAYLTPGGGTCLILAGTNDMSTSATAPQAPIKQMVRQCLAGGVQPVLCTIPPQTAGAPHLAITTYNAWLRRLAADNGIPCIDLYAALVDPATGNYLAGLSTDGIHPTTAGIKLMAPLVPAAVGVSPLPLPLTLCLADDDTLNLLQNGLMLHPGPTAAPTSWQAIAGGGSGTLASAAGSGADVGNWLTLARTGGSGPVQTYQQFSAGYSSGDTLALSCKLKTSGIEAGSGQYYLALYAAPTSTIFYFVYNWTNELATPATIYGEFTVPQGTTGMQLVAGIQTGTGTISVGQATVINLTALLAANDTRL